MAKVSDSKRINWISIVRGITILLVVLNHVNLVDKSTGLNHAFFRNIDDLFEPWRMPLFLFASGCLLQLTRIRKNWPIKKMYADKAKRLLIPFVFFATVFYFLKLSMNSFVKTKIDFSIGDFIQSFFFYEGHPSEFLWFLPIIFEMMLLYPLYIWLEKKPIRMIVFLILLIGFYQLDFSDYYQYNVFYILKLNHYLIFFFFGVFFFKYKIFNYVNRWWIFIAFIVAYIGAYQTDILLLKSLVGILMMVSGCIVISKYTPSLFKSFRDYIYQIYLMSMLFQGFVELILWNKLFYNESLFYIFFVLNFLAGLYGPVLIAKCVEKIPVAGIRTCFGLK